jgi:hypothetical protein
VEDEDEDDEVPGYSAQTQSLLLGYGELAEQSAPPSRPKFQFPDASGVVAAAPAGGVVAQL